MKQHCPRSGTRHVIVVACLCVVGMIGATKARAARVYQYDGQYVVWADKECVRYLSPSSFPEGSLNEVLILESMGLWNIIPASDFLYFYSPLDQDYPIDNFDGYNDTAIVPAAQLDPGVLGITYMVNDGALWFDTDVLFSDSPNGVGYTMETNPPCDIVNAPTPTNGFSFLLSAVHEMGHSLGLGHDPIGDEAPGSPWFLATMNPAYPAGGPISQHNFIEVHTDDRAGLRFLYPDEGILESPIAELASASFIMGPTLGVVEPLYFSPSPLYPGERLTLASLVENFGSTDEIAVEQGFYLSIDPMLETTDEFLGALAWDFAVNEAFAFEVYIDLPEDIAAGAYYIGAILDDINAVAEEYEDNNAAVACEPVTIAQFPPAIDSISPQLAGCGLSYTGPLPLLSHPLNMNPITWTLNQGPAGMTIDPATGVVTWPNPLPSARAYTVLLHAANGAGTSTTSWSLSIPVGDLDGGGTVDRGDISPLGGCLSGPGSTAGNGCDCADDDADGDIDLRDVGTFQTVFGG